MKVIITKIDSFTSKAGVPYVKAQYMDDKGNTAFAMWKSEEFKSFNFDPAKALAEKDLKEIMETYQGANIEYNSFGRVVSLS